MKIDCMNIIGLKQKVLKFAIHGKLVEQDKTETPASVLLEELRSEKKRLIKERILKETKKSLIYNTLSEENIPYELPKGWCWCIVDDIAYVAAGSTPSKDAFVEDGIPYIKMYNLRKQKIDFEFKPQYIKEDVHNGKLKRSRTEVGDLLMNIVGPPLGKLAIIPPTLPKANFNQAAVLIRPLLYKEALTKWLFYYLSEMSEINSIKTKGSAGQVNISLTQSLNMRVPLPPYSELLRIIPVIDSCMSLIENIDDSISEIKRTSTQAREKILDLAIHGKLVNQDSSDEPASELLKRIADLKTKLIKEKKIKKQDVSDVPVDGEFDIPDNWCWVNINLINLHSGKTVDPLKNKEKDYELYSVPVYESGYPEMLKGAEIGSSKQIVERDDVLLSKINPHLNRVWSVSHYDTNRECIASSEWVIVRCPLIDSKYLRYVLSSKYFLKLMMSNLTGVGGSLTRAQGNCVKEYPIPLPPISEQHRIVNKLNEIMPLIDALK